MSKRYRSRPTPELTQYTFVVVTRKEDETGLPDNSTTEFYNYDNEQRAHHWARTQSEAGYWVETYQLLGDNINVNQ